jgi:hypothetical protein
MPERLRPPIVKRTSSDLVAETVAAAAHDPSTGSMFDDPEIARLVNSMSGDGPPDADAAGAADAAPVDYYGRLEASPSPTEWLRASMTHDDGNFLDYFEGIDDDLFAASTEDEDRATQGRARGAGRGRRQSGRR